MSAEKPTQIRATGEATGFIPAPGDKGKPIIVESRAAPTIARIACHLNASLENCLPSRAKLHLLGECSLSSS